MLSSAVLVAVAALIGLASAAPAPAATLTTATATASNYKLIVVPTVQPCRTSSSSASATAVTSVTTTATVTTETPSTPVVWIPAAHDQKACDSSSFSASTREDPIPYADWEACAQLYSSWDSFNGTFNIGNNADSAAGLTLDSRAEIERANKVSYTPVLHSDSCTFALHSADLAQIVAIGDVDIDEILKTALNEFSSGSLLAVKGSLNCSVRGDRAAKAELKWQLYYPGA